MEESTSNESSPSMSLGHINIIADSTWAGWTRSWWGIDGIVLHSRVSIPLHAPLATLSRIGAAPTSRCAISRQVVKADDPDGTDNRQFA